MKKLLKFFCSILFPAILILRVSSYASAQSSPGPQPPPVDIKLAMVGAPRIGEKTEIKLTVTPLEDMDADISCLLPQGIEPIREEGIMLLPYRERYIYDIQREMEYQYAVGLWIGPLKAGITKEFTFHIIVPDKQLYQLIAHLEALAKWGAKEDVLVIDIE